MTQIIEKRMPTFFSAWVWLTRMIAKWRADPPSAPPVPAYAPAHAPEPAEITPSPIIAVDETKEALPQPARPGKAAETSGAKTTRARRKTKTQEPADVSTFSELLDHIDGSFETMCIPPIKGNWLPRSEIRALHKLGVYVPTPWQLEMVDHPSLPSGMALPSIASAAMIPKRLDEKGKVHPRFAFAIREPRLPPSVEQFRGKVYRFGYAVALPHKQGDLTSAPHSFWIWAWIVVREDGSIVAPSELRPVVHQIHHRRVMSAYRGNRSTYTSRSWHRPTMMHGDDMRPDDEMENYLLNVFRQLMLWWVSRDQRWSVGVRKGGNRITFSIDPEHTAAYFADRNKTIAVDGRSKKIIHFVKEHTRSNGSVVRAHIRGEREFVWRDAKCAVTAPNLYGRITTVPTFAPVDPRDVGTVDVLTSEEMAVMLADVEDRIAA